MAAKDAKDIPQWVDNLVNRHKVAVFAKTHCPYCINAIAALRTLNVADMYVEYIDKNPLCDAIQDFMKEKTGGRSVPRVFINGAFFGGGDDTVAAAGNGKLAETLKACGAL